MRILILTTAYGPGRPHAPLIESLSEVLAKDGHQVRVAGVNWDAAPNSLPQHYFEPSGVEVLMTAPREPNGFGRVGKLLGKWIFSSRDALPHVRRAFGDDPYDLMMVMTPLVTLRGLLLWGKRRSAHTYAYITDFFPIQHASTGMMPGKSFTALAKWGETQLLRGFDTLATMSPMGVKFLRERFRLRPGQPIDTLYLWTDEGTHQPRPRAEVRRAFGLPLDKPIVVFSGQLTVGRGVEEMLEAAELAAREGHGIQFLFIGTGSLRPLIEQAVARGAGNITLLDPLSREDYLDVIASCDAGMVATVASLDAPTFPSKSIDYLKAGLPIVASVESTTDYDQFVNERGIGMAVHAGEPSRLLKAIVTVTGDPQRAAQMRAAGRHTLESTFSARRAADQVLQAAERKG